MESTNRLIVLTTVYNCQDYLDRCLATISRQKYKNFHCFLLDDMSTDESRKICKKWIGRDHRFTLIPNDRKYYQPGNYDQIISSNFVLDDDVIVEVDGDDYLPDENVFSRVNSYYSDSNLWLTYGSFVYSSGQRGFAREIPDISNIRNTPFTATHLRTWKAHLWRRISKKDLFGLTDWYAESAGDTFFMFPMVEMAGPKRVKFIYDTNYVYNELNQLNDHKVNPSAQVGLANLARSRPAYKELQ